MKKISGLLFLGLLLCCSRLSAQVENVIVETYYISDANDATDTSGGNLADRSTTYRIYIDLIAGSKLKKIYGDANHALKIASTEIFFNNIDRGQSFGKDFSKSNYGDNTVALDSWLTIGQATKTGAKTYFGVLKSMDDDGSFVGGTNNDGGSEEIPGGLLINNDPAAGIPLTTSDGMDTMSSPPDNWYNYGIIDSISFVDSTIFGSVKACTQFISNNAGLMNSGVAGVNPDSNLVLVAQLTTRGELSFELNLEVIDTSGQTVKYVANDSVLVNGEVLCRNLKFPFAMVCGCPDPNYLEYVADRDCDAQDSCRTLIVFGCMDTMACNYNPDANFHIQSLCCYPGYCQDRDISVICPSLNYEKRGTLNFNLAPDPVHDVLTFQAPASIESESICTIYNCLGEMVFQKNIAMSSVPVNVDFDIASIRAGTYVFMLQRGASAERAMFIKY